MLDEELVGHGLKHVAAIICSNAEIREDEGLQASK